MRERKECTGLGASGQRAAFPVSRADRTETETGKPLSPQHEQMQLQVSTAGGTA